MNSEKIKSKLSSITDSMNIIWTWIKENKAKAITIVIVSGLVIKDLKSLNQCRIENRILKQMLYEGKK